MRLAAIAAADAEAIKIRTVAEATAMSIRLVTDAIAAGGENYFRYRQIEMLPQIAPVIAKGLRDAKLITVTSNGANGAGAPDSTARQITDVIQTVLAAPLVSRGSLDGPPSKNGA